MANKSSASSFATSLGGSLFLLFLGLKLAKVIDWGWVWITAPLWIPFAIAFGVCGLVGVILTTIKVIRIFAGSKK